MLYFRTKLGVGGGRVIMGKRRKEDIKMNLDLLIKELKEDPYHKFNLAFCLMTIIPFLVFFYLLAVKLFTLNIFIGDIGLVLFVSLFISICGLLISYGVIKNILKRLVLFAVRAKHSDELKSTFVAYVSHELRTPLTLIKMNLSNIGDGIVGKINAKQKEMLESSQGVVDRLSRLVNDFLDLHKIEAGMLQAKRELCNLRELLEEQTNEFRALCTKKQIRLHKDIFDGDLSVWADYDKIMQVVNNLLSNAIKYTPAKGEVNLRIFSLDGFIRLEVNRYWQRHTPGKTRKDF